jgi:replicative DNA helicase
VQEIMANKLQGILTGFPRTDLVTRGFRDIVIVGGAPGTFKSTFVFCIALHISSSGRPVLFYALEMTTLSLIQRGMMMVSLKDLTWPQLVAAPDKMNEAKLALKQATANLFIVDGATRTTPETIRNHIELLKQRYPMPPVVVIDHGRLVDMGQSFRDDLMRQEELMADLMQIVHSTGSTLVLVHELNKAGMKGATLEGIKGSVSAVYDSSLVLFLVDPEAGDGKDLENVPEYDPEYEQIRATAGKRIMLVVKKNRFGPSQYKVPFRIHGAYFKIVEEASSIEPDPDEGQGLIAM